MPSRRLHLVSGQKVFHSDVPEWRYVESSAGLSLRKIDPACEDLLQWDDGAVAAGVRRLGKGMVFHLGANSLLLPFQVLEWLHVKKNADCQQRPGRNDQAFCQQQWVI